MSRLNFGAMNLRTGTRLFVPREKGRSGDFQAFLEGVRWHYRGRREPRSRLASNARRLRRDPPPIPDPRPQRWQTPASTGLGLRL
jgi:hypothetical protein